MNIKKTVLTSICIACLTTSSVAAPIGAYAACKPGKAITVQSKHHKTSPLIDAVLKGISTRELDQSRDCVTTTGITDKQLSKDAGFKLHTPKKLPFGFQSYMGGTSFDSVGVFSAYRAYTKDDPAKLYFGTENYKYLNAEFSVEPAYYKYNVLLALKDGENRKQKNYKGVTLYYYECQVSKEHAFGVSKDKEKYDAMPQMLTSKYILWEKDGIIYNISDFASGISEKEMWKLAKGFII